MSVQHLCLQCLKLHDQHDIVLFATKLSTQTGNCSNTVPTCRLQVFADAPRMAALIGRKRQSQASEMHLRVAKRETDPLVTVTSVSYVWTLVLLFSP